MRNGEGIDKRKIAKKFDFKSHDIAFDFVVRFCATRVIEG